MAKKFQTGGVSQVIPRPIGVGDIPTFQAPTFDLQPIPVQEMLAIASKMQLHQARQEASDLAEQKYQDSLENAYMDFNSKFFGPVHTERQKQTVESLGQKYSIPEDGMSGLIGNQVALKDGLNNFRKAFTSPEYISIAGEVDRGNQFRAYAEKNFDKETFVEWEQNAWQPYVSGQAGLEDANPVRFKPSKALKQVNFRTAESSLMKSFDTTDLNNEDEVREMAERLAMSYYETNPDAAVAQGLLQVNEDGTYQLTAPALDKFITAVKVEQRDKQREAGLSMDKWETQRAISDAYADANRQARGSGSGSGKAPADIEKAYSLIEALEGIQIPRDNPQLQALVEGYANAGTEAERDAILTRIRALAKNLPDSSDAAIARRIANERSQRLTEQGAISFPPAGTSPVVPTVPPKKTMGDLFNKHGL